MYHKRERGVNNKRQSAEEMACSPRSEKVGKSGEYPPDVVNRMTVGRYDYSMLQAHERGIIEP